MDRDWRPITENIARDADKLLSGFDDSALYIYETVIPKKVASGRPQEDKSTEEKEI